MGQAPRKAKTEAIPSETHIAKASTPSRPCGEIEQLRLIVRSRLDTDTAVCTRASTKNALRTRNACLEGCGNSVKSRGKLTHYPYAGQADATKNSAQPARFVAHFTICLPSAEARGSPFQAWP